MLFGLIGSFMFLKMQTQNIFIGAIIFVTHILLDYVDGEIARYRMNITLTGKYLDDTTHAITIPILLLCISFGVFGVFGNASVLFLGCLAAVCEPIGHGVHWGYPNRILYSEILSTIVKYKSVVNRETPNYVLQVEKKSIKEKIAKLFIRFRLLVLKTSIIQKLYEKIWFENRIVNIVIVVGLVSPFLSRFQYPDLYAKIFSLIIIIYGINRPIVLLQRYLGRIMFKNETLEYEINKALDKLEDLNPVKRKSD